MTDRELLELAAKAYGWRELYEDQSFDGKHLSYMVQNGQHQSFNWNPLTDDGDALRLAVKLKLHILDGIAQSPDGDMFVEQDVEGDPCAATRRAIARAAAEIGKEGK